MGTPVGPGKDTHGTLGPDQREGRGWPEHSSAQQYSAETRQTLFSVFFFLLFFLFLFVFLCFFSLSFSFILFHSLSLSFSFFFFFFFSLVSLVSLISPFFLFSFCFLCLCLTSHATMHLYILDIIDSVDSHQCVAQPFPQLSRKVYCALDTDTLQTFYLFFSCFSFLCFSLFLCVSFFVSFFFFFLLFLLFQVTNMLMDGLGM